MQKDFKIGLGVGLVFVAAVTLWLSTLPNFSTEARALQAASGNSRAPAAQQAGQPDTGPAVYPETVPAPFPTSNVEQQNVSDEHVARIHVVQKGETLSAISSKYYGSPNQWRKILSANRQILPDPDKLTPGVRLVIPE